MGDTGGAIATTHEAGGSNGVLLLAGEDSLREGPVFAKSYARQAAKLAMRPETMEGVERGDRRVFFATEIAEGILG